MNPDIFRNWFHQEFVPTVEKNLKDNNLPRKALLILDNAPSHPATEELTDGDIKVLFLPANVTSVCQPMDQCVLASLKKRYRRHLLTSLIMAINNKEDYLATLKRINMFDVIQRESWEEIPAITIVRSWKKLLEREGDNFNSDITHEPHVGKEEADNNLVSLLERIPACAKLNEDDVREWMTSDEVEELGDSDFIEIVTQGEEGDIQEEEPLEGRSHPTFGRITIR